VATLLDGSTYNSIFGVSDRKDATPYQLREIRAWLLDVEYVFLDEVSMLSVCDMFHLSRQMILITNNENSPFEGLNFIVAGDFAQLPPVIGWENAILYSWTIKVCSNI